MLSKKGKTIEFILAIILILIGVSFRILPHPWNFTPISALALFGGVYLSKRIALILPLTAMLISDYFIGFYEIGIMASVYASFLLVVLLGFLVKKHKKWHTILGGSIAGSVLFFLITNFAVWAFTLWYPHNFSGLMTNYLLALPFFRNALIGDLFYVAIFFGTFEIISVFVKRKFVVMEKLRV
jgi:hypothetical protein